MRWYRWLGLGILILISGIPVALVKAILYLFSGSPRGAVAVLLEVPLNWLEWVFVAIPIRLGENPVIGVSMLIGSIAVLAFCFWLIFRRLEDE